MSGTETRAVGARDGNYRRFRDVVIAGLASGLVFGLFIQLLLGRMAAIGGMYTLGDPSLSIGWVAHFFNSAVFALVFGVVSWWEPVAERLSDPGGAVAVGAGYGAVLWLTNIVVIWPLWMNAVGVMTLPFPYLSSVRPLVGHLVWGALLGGIFWRLNRR